MQLIINGHAKDTPALTTVADLAKWLELPSFGTAIELNGQVIRKIEYQDCALKDGDHLEVVRLVGGG
jgi:thiamine biosynthesis protein ThiS